MHDSFIDHHWLCIVGALAPSFDSLPENMRQKLSTLINIILDWLTELLDKGKKSNNFSFSESPKIKALTVYSTLLSTLQMTKVLRDNTVYLNIQEELLKI